MVLILCVAEKGTEEEEGECAHSSLCSTSERTLHGQNCFTGTWSSTQEEEEDGDASQIDKKPSILQTLLRGKQQVL